MYNSNLIKIGLFNKNSKILVKWTKIGNYNSNNNKKYKMYLNNHNN